MCDRGCLVHLVTGAAAAGHSGSAPPAHTATPAHPYRDTAPRRRTATAHHRPPACWGGWGGGLGLTASAFLMHHNTFLVRRLRSPCRTAPPRKPSPQRGNAASPLSHPAHPIGVPCLAPYPPAESVKLLMTFTHHIYRHIKLLIRYGIPPPHIHPLRPRHSEASSR